MNDLEETGIKKVSLLFLYIGKLKEFGLIEGEGDHLTTKGFDVAMSAYEEGIRLEENEIRALILKIPEMENIKEELSTMILYLQDKGFDEFKKLVEKIK